MAGEIYIADKITLDLVKSNTDTIKQDTTFIKSQFPISSSGTDWGKYKPLVAKTFVPEASILNTYNEFFTITGKGFISALIVAHGYLNSNYTYAQIIIDDVIYYEGMVGYDYGKLSISGFYLYNLDSISGDAQGAFSPMYWGNIPINTDSTTKGRTYKLSSPIFFNNNVKVKLKYITQSQNNAQILFMGGIQA